jgi:hypothetical protein
VAPGLPSAAWCKSRRGRMETEDRAVQSTPRR